MPYKVHHRALCVHSPESAQFNCAAEGIGMQEAGKQGSFSGCLVRVAEVQARAAEVLALRQDCVIQAETGSGKTLAFLLPAMAQVVPEQPVALPTSNPPFFPRWLAVACQPHTDKEAACPRCVARSGPFCARQPQLQSILWLGDCGTRVPLLPA